MRKCCTACGKEIGGGQMGMASHWGAHRRAFFKALGRHPMSNDEVRSWLKGNMGCF